MYLLQTIAALAVTLGILVTIHEWGHFFVARRCGVKVLRFSVGFGKPLLKWKDRFDTEYVIAAIPLGGYVKMLDEREGTVPAELLEQTFNRKSVYQRIAIVAAGPLVNLLFAVLAYWVMFVSGVSTVVPVLGEPLKGSLSEQVGVLSGGEVISVDGKQANSWEAINLLLVSRIGDTGRIEMQVKYPDSTLPVEYKFPITEWNVQVEKESPLRALGIQSWRPPVPAIIGAVREGDAASQAGLKEGDKVLAVDAVQVEDWFELVERVRASAGQRLNFEIEREGAILNVEVLPALHQLDSGEQVGFIGAGVKPVEWPASMERVIHYDIIDAIPVSLDKTYQMVSLTLDSIWKMIEGVISVKNLSGPITIAKVAGASAASGFEEFVNFLAYLSVSLGVLNLLPIPVLDGGHLVYYLVEAVRRKPVSEHIQALGYRIGMSILLGLMALAIFNDLARL